MEGKKKESIEHGTSLVQLYLQHRASSELCASEHRRNREDFPPWPETRPCFSILPPDPLPVPPPLPSPLALARLLLPWAPTHIRLTKSAGTSLCSCSSRRRRRPGPGPPASTPPVPRGRAAVGGRAGCPGAVPAAGGRWLPSRAHRPEPHAPRESPAPAGRGGAAHDKTPSRSISLAVKLAVPGVTGRSPSSGSCPGAINSRQVSA